MPRLTCSIEEFLKHSIWEKGKKHIAKNPFLFPKKTFRVVKNPSLLHEHTYISSNKYLLIRINNCILFCIIRIGEFAFRFSLWFCCSSKPKEEVI